MEPKIYEEAINEFNKAIEFDPKDVSAYINRGNAYLRLAISMRVSKI